MKAAGTQSTHSRLASLDALRGAAAFCVMLFHFRGLFPAGTLIPHAYLAVDFFFILSGFVIARTYEHRLAAGMGWPSFIKIRLVRLLPLVALSITLGAAYLIAREMLDPGRISASYLVLAFVFGLFLLPLDMVEGGDAFPLNGPSWSLFFELVVNIVWGLLGGRLSNRTLFVILVTSGLGLAWFATLGNWNALGGELPPSGFARASFGFFLGTALYRWRESPALRRIPSLHPLAGTIMLLIIFCAPATWPDIYNFAATAMALSFIVLASSRYKVLRGYRIAEVAGLLSYPVYVLHTPVMQLLGGALKATDLYPVIPLPLFGLMAIAATLFAAFLAARYFDIPVRRWLGTKIVPPHLRDIKHLSH